MQPKVYPKASASESLPRQPSSSRATLPSSSTCSGFSLSAKGSRDIHEVWSWNFEDELCEFLSAAARAGANAVIALSTDFPRFLHQQVSSSDRPSQHKALLENVCLLQLIQIGFAIADEYGAQHGTWNFNLVFDAELDVDTEASEQFLEIAGIDFRRHAADGVCPYALGQRLAQSSLMPSGSISPLWVTLYGFYDLGFLLDILSNEPLPENYDSYDSALADMCPKHHELSDYLASESMHILRLKHGMCQSVADPNAGRDARLILELHLQTECAPSSPKIGRPTSSTVGQEMATAAQLAAAMEESERSEIPPLSWGASARRAMAGGHTSSFARSPFYKAVTREAVAGGA